MAAACASSLYAIKLACDELLAGRADVMLAGGCSRPDCQNTQMGFAQLRALAPSGRCSPFDARADGLVVGEGAGVFVLKRLADALNHGDTIHATVAGVGLSNDMYGNLLAPAKEGQLRAMRAAYERAGAEGHGHVVGERPDDPGDDSVGDPVPGRREGEHHEFERSGEADDREGEDPLDRDAPRRDEGRHGCGAGEMRNGLHRIPPLSALLCKSGAA